MLNRMRLFQPELWARLLYTLEDWANYLFDSRTTRIISVFRIAILLGLYFWGVYLWGVFYSWGHISFDFLDWAEVTGPRFSILQDAARTGQFPFHTVNPNGLRGVTDRYLSIADTPLSPQYFLLRFFDMGYFTFINTLILYTFGYIGLLLLYRKYKLSIWVFSVLFLLFNFNGNIVTHLAVGHANWVGQFLLPYFVYLVMDLVEHKKGGWGWLIAVVFTMVLVLLQGHFHLYLWCLIFLGFLLFFQLHLLKPIILVCLLTILISMPRLLPPALILQGVTNEYLGGFSSLADLITGLIILRDPNSISAMVISNTFPLNGWELDFYIGIVGGVFIILFGLAVPIWRLTQTSWGKNNDSTGLSILILPCVVFIIFSLGNAFEIVVRVLIIPPVTGERVTSRMLIVPLSFLLAIAAINLQCWLDHISHTRPQKRLPGWLLWCLIALSIILFHDLDRHMQAWRIRYLDSLVNLFPKVPFDPAQHMLANHQDPIYTNLIVGGSIIALITIGTVVWIAIRQRRKEMKISSRP